MEQQHFPSPRRRRACLSAQECVLFIAGADRRRARRHLCAADGPEVPAQPAVCQEVEWQGPRRRGRGVNSQLLSSRVPPVC
eukprot:4738348-Prymnesium_polylepis.1